MQAPLRAIPSPYQLHESSLDALLNFGVERVMLLTRAHGAAIALDDGDGMRCLASAGEIAPPIGTPIDSRSGLTGACLRLGSLMHCDSTESDPMVDRESCRRLGIGSIIAVPIALGGRVIGLFEVFARQPYAFDTSDCYGIETAAKTLADSITRSGWFSKTSGNQTPRFIHSAESASQTPQTESGVANRRIALATSPVENESAREATHDGTGLALIALSSAGYKYSFKEKVMLHQQAILWSAGALLAAACLWLGIGIPRQFRNAAAHETVDSQQIQPGQSPIASKPRAGSALTNSANVVWVEDVRRRAERGDADAELKLGAAYANGQYGPPNYNESVKWLTRSADHGNITAAAVLGAFDWAGRGTTSGYIDAYMWSAIAQAKGDEASRYRVAILESRMSPAELLEGKRRAAAWLGAHNKAIVPKTVASNER